MNMFPGPRTYLLNRQEMADADRNTSVKIGIPSLVLMERAAIAVRDAILDDFAENLADIANVEKAPKMEGRSMTMFLAKKS